jgi:hypothetical protein
MKLSVSLAFVIAVGSSAFVPSSNNVARSQTQLQNDLWGQPPDKKDGKEMSKALPFLAKPKLLDGTMAGDVGFE